METTNQIIRKRKSEALTDAEKKAFKSFLNRHRTLVESAEAIGVSRNVLERVKIVFSGSPENIALIRKAIAA